MIRPCTFEECKQAQTSYLFHMFEPSGTQRNDELLYSMCLECCMRSVFRTGQAVVEFMCFQCRLACELGNKIPTVERLSLTTSRSPSLILWTPAYCLRAVLCLSVVRSGRIEPTERRSDHRRARRMTARVLLTLRPGADHARRPRLCASSRRLVLLSQSLPPTMHGCRLARIRSRGQPTVRSSNCASSGPVRLSRLAAHAVALRWSPRANTRLSATCWTGTSDTSASLVLR